MNNKIRLNKRTKRILIIAISVSVAFILLAVLFTYLFSSLAPRIKLSGKWEYKNDTTYTFNVGNDGSMHTMDKDYLFDYKIEGQTVKIDFKDNGAKDCEYKYSISGNKLILKGGKGTVGGTYELTKSK